MPTTVAWRRQGGAGHVQALSVDVSEIQFQKSVTPGPESRAELGSISFSGTDHLQGRCVDLATELCVLNLKFNEQAKEITRLRQDCAVRGRDIKEVRKAYEEESQTALKHLRRAESLEGEVRNLETENSELSRDNKRLLGVLRRRQAASVLSSLAVQQEVNRSRQVSWSDVNKGDLASARDALKASRQECGHLAQQVREHASKIALLEESKKATTRKLEEAGEKIAKALEEKEALEEYAGEARTASVQAASGLARVSSEKVSLMERLLQMEGELQEAGEARASAELEAKTLRLEAEMVKESMQAKETAHDRHGLSLIQYREAIDAQSAALQATRVELLREKVLRREAEHAERVRHVMMVDQRREELLAGGGGNDRSSLQRGRSLGRVGETTAFFVGGGTEGVGEWRPGGGRKGSGRPGAGADYRGPVPSVVRDQRSEEGRKGAPIR